MMGKNNAPASHAENHVVGVVGVQKLELLSTTFCRNKRGRMSLTTSSLPDSATSSRFITLKASMRDCTTFQTLNTCQ